MEETIDLRNIISIILTGKFVIAIWTIAALLFSGIISWFVLDETYQSKAVVQVASGVQDTGIMSNYVATEFTPMIFMERIQNEQNMKAVFKEAGYKDFSTNNLTLLNKQDTNLITMTYQAASPEEAHEKMGILLDETQKQMDTSVKETLNQLEQTYLNESNALSDEIEFLMNKYNQVVISNKLPEILILQTITSEQFVLDLSQYQTSALSTITGTLQNELLQLKAQIDSKATEYSNVLTKYQSVKTGLDSFKPDPFIRIITEPTLPIGPSSPNKILNMAIGLILGLVIGVSWVLFRVYWKNTTPVK